MANFNNTFPNEKEQYYEEVKKIIDEMVIEETQIKSYKKLDWLGEKAVPAIIMLMDDRRNLPAHRITLKIYSEHWEANREYGPEQVVDALSAILNQITGHSYYSISNGGTVEDRKKDIDAWRIYLYYSKQKYFRLTHKKNLK